MFRLFVPLVCIIMLTGCALTAPSYQARVENIQLLRDSGIRPAKVAEFVPGKGANVDSISLRGSPMSSPVGGKFTAYLAEALRSELRAAKLYQEDVSVEIGGVMLKNDVDVSGINEGSAELEAQVTVRQGDQVRYERVRYTRIKFESAFAGSIAIPRGTLEYPNLVQKFLSDLYADKDFINALK